MAHAHDRTLLASLGFADPDKGNARHDLACRYLAEPQQAERIVGLVVTKFAPFLWKDRSWSNKLPDADVIESRYDVDVYLERPVSKGSDRYKTTIGFLDVCVLAREQHLFVPVGCQDATPYRSIRHKHFGWNSIAQGEKMIAIEVKASPVPAASLLRQLRLYAEYLDMSGPKVGLVAATLYDMPPEDVVMLKSQGVTPIRLGKGFDEWVARLKQRPADAEIAVEF